MDDYPHYQYQQFPYQQSQQDPSSQVQAYAYDHHQSTTHAYYDYTYNNNNNNHNQQFPYQHYPSHDHSFHSYYHPPEPTTHIHQNTYFPGQHPAAAHAQLTQFAGSVDASHRATQPQTGQSTLRGGSRRGGRHCRGRGPRSDGSAPSFRGRGRGQGVGRQFPPHGAASTSNSTFPPTEGAASLMPPAASVSGHASVHVPVQMPVAPFQPPRKMAWCELCRVDCNTQEILEQHKNGKRHKRNLQMQEELHGLNRLITGQQSMPFPNSEFDTEVVQSDNVVGSKEEAPQEDVPSNAVNDNNRNETEPQKDAVEKPKVLEADSAAAHERKSRDHFEARGRHGLKRKMNSGHGVKYLRINDGPKRPAEPPKSKQVVPFICELCNVRCESQVVFDSHLAGKKHLSKLKQFRGHQTLFGEAGLQALYPPNLNPTSSSLISQIQQGVTDPQVVLAQLLTYMLTQAQAPGLTGTQVPALATTPAAAIAPALAVPMPAPACAVAPGSSLETQYDQCPIQGSEAGNGKDVAAEAESHPQSIAAELEALPTASLDTKEENETLASEVKEDSLPQDNSIDIALTQDDTKAVSFSQDSSAMASLNPDMEADQVSFAVAADKVTLTPTCASLD